MVIFFPDKSINWTEIAREILDDRVTDESREQLYAFVKSTVSDTMTKLLEIMAVFISDLDSIFPHLLSILDQASQRKLDESDETISSAVGRLMLRLAFDKLDVSSVEEPEVTEAAVVNCNRAKSAKENPEVTVIGPSTPAPTSTTTMTNESESDFSANDTQVTVKQRSSHRIFNSF